MSDETSIIELLRQLVQIPSRAGVDSYRPIADLAERWLADHRLACKVLTHEGITVGLVSEIDGALPGPCYVLNATLDTAGFGDESRWNESPTSASVRDGWMYGRGTADSKSGAALFSHLMVEFSKLRDSLSGKLVLLLDLDEHTGGFAGVRTYLDSLDGQWPKGFYIGYPGNDRIVIGSRGFERATLSAHGLAAHSGGSSHRGINAVIHAAKIAGRLSSVALAPPRNDDSFPLPPQVTVTAMHGGSGFSMVPDACEVLVDVRLTPDFTAEDARQLVERIVETEDADTPGQQKTTLAWQQGWPAYQISEQEPIVSALHQAVKEVFGKIVPLAVVGPSNIGNHLHTLGIPAISGFGVSYRGVHAADECIDLSTIEPVYHAYRSALRRLLLDR